ncbi:hypothetical protein D3C81_1891650 [compost metagenome]|jgi:hypothetical protein
MQLASQLLQVFGGWTDDCHIGFLCGPKDVFSGIRWLKFIPGNPMALGYIGQQLGLAGQ